MPALPPGLDPITAGRFGLWLLGKRNQHKASKRRASGTCVYGDGSTGRLLQLLMPWTVNEYPGAHRFVAALCGISIRTAERWFGDDARLPAKHALTMAALARTKAEQYAAIADELERHAASKAPRAKGIIRQRAERRRATEV